MSCFDKLPCGDDFFPPLTLGGVGGGMYVYKNINQTDPNPSLNCESQTQHEAFIINYVIEYVWSALGPT